MTIDGSNRRKADLVGKCRAEERVPRQLEQVRRQTGETSIELSLDLDGAGAEVRGAPPSPFQPRTASPFILPIAPSVLSLQEWHARIPKEAGV